MEYKLYSVKDELTGKYMSPMFVEDVPTAEQEAIRQFRSNVNNIKLWKDNPNDFSLWYVGMFSDTDGTIVDNNFKVISGRSVLNVANET